MLLLRLAPKLFVSVKSPKNGKKPGNMVQSHRTNKSLTPGQAICHPLPSATAQAWPDQGSRKPRSRSGTACHCEAPETGM